MKLIAFLIILIYATAAPSQELCQIVSKEYGFVNSDILNAVKEELKIENQDSCEALKFEDGDLKFSSTTGQLYSVLNGDVFVLNLDNEGKFFKRLVFDVPSYNVWYKNGNFMMIKEQQMDPDINEANFKMRSNKFCFVKNQEGICFNQNESLNYYYFELFTESSDFTFKTRSRVMQMCMDAALHIVELSVVVKNLFKSCY